MGHNIGIETGRNIVPMVTKLLYKLKDIVLLQRIMTIKQTNISPYQNEIGLWFQSDFMATNRDVWKLFRSVEKLDVEKNSPSDIVALLKSGGYRLIFSNPYRSANALAIYQACQENELAYLVVERGSLPGSMFLDETGFLNDSQVYASHLWRALPLKKVTDWLARFKAQYSASNATLERQPARSEGTDDLIERDGRTCVAIILQKRDDVVVRHFVKNNRDYDTFLTFCESLVNSYGSRCVFIAKPHPLDPDVFVAGAKDGTGYHVNDLLGKSDVVLTYNSGVGVLAMIHGKPLGVFGQAYYGHRELCQTVHSAKEFEKLLRLKPNNDTRARFLYHLTQNCYSTANFLKLPIGDQRTVAMTFDQITLTTMQGRFLLKGHTSTFVSLTCAVGRAIGNKARRLIAGTRYKVY